MHDIEKKIVSAVTSPGYQPLKPKALLRKIGFSLDQYADFKVAIRKLIKEGRLELAKNSTIRPSGTTNAVTGVFRKTSGGFGFVRPQPLDGKPASEIYIPQESVGDASTGDTVLARIGRKSKRPDLGPRGDIVQ